jgi:hypothetical protein
MLQSKFRAVSDHHESATTAQSQKATQLEGGKKGRSLPSLTILWLALPLI